MRVKFSIERNGETQYTKHYFLGNEPHVFHMTQYGEYQVKIEFDRFVKERREKKIRLGQLRRGTYLKLPQKLKNKNAINTADFLSGCPRYRLYFFPAAIQLPKKHLGYR